MRHFHTKTFAFLLLLVVLGPLSNVLFREGMKHVGSIGAPTVGAMTGYLASVFSSGAIWLGIVARGTFLVAYMLLLSWADYSYVMPASSASYALVVLLGYLLLGEVVTLERWAGVLLICLGVTVVGATPANTTQQK